MATAGYLLLSPGAGALAAVFFYGGLWLTVRHLRSGRHPAIVSALSLVIRLGAVALVFAVIATAGGIGPLACAFLGFIAGRIAVVRALGAAPAGKREAILP